MSRAPPQLMFDDGSRVMMEDSASPAALLATGDSSSAEGPLQRGSIPLHTYYEIDRLSQEVVELWVESSRAARDDGASAEPGNQGGILRVALQFPDELLEDSPEVCWLLEDKLREDLEALPRESRLPPASSALPAPFCFVLGDTTVNSCCPDEVAALHLNADVLVHYGHACLSPTESLPVLYSFGKVPWEDLDGTVQALEAARNERTEAKGTIAYNQNYLLLYQVGYHHAMEELRERWSRCDEGLRVVAAQIPETSQKLMGRIGREATSGTMAGKSSSCCQQSSDAPIDGGMNRGGCCGASSSGSPAVVAESSSDEQEISSASCCQKPGDSGCSTSASSRVNVVSEMEKSNTDNESSLDPEDCQTPRRRPLVVGGLALPSDQISSWEDLKDFTVVFIMGNPEEDVDGYSTNDITTPQQRQFANSMLCLMSLPHGEPEGGYWIYSPKHHSLRTDVYPPPALKKQLQRRYFLTQKARDAGVFGILVSNLSQQHLVGVVKSLQTVIQDAGRTSYSFAVGKINPAKLANFAEIETFVIVACREHSLLDMEREYYIPVITPMELECALENLQWGMQPYSLDCQDVLVRQQEEARKKRERLLRLQAGDDETHQVTDADDDNSIDSVDSDAPYFSMVTGRYEQRKQRRNAPQDLDLSVLPGQGQLTEYKSEASDFLRKREYQGLQSLVGQTEVKVAVPGMRGIASEYRANDEPNQKSSTQ